METLLVDRVPAANMCSHIIVNVWQSVCYAVPVPHARLLYCIAKRGMHGRTDRSSNASPWSRDGRMVVNSPCMQSSIALNREVASGPSSSMCRRMKDAARRRREPRVCMQERATRQEKLSD